MTIPTRVTTLALLAGTLLPWGLPAADEATIAPRGPNSRISAVTVYEDRALVTRTLAAALAPGRNTLRFEGLPAGLDERTLRAGVEGADARVTGLTSSLTRAAAPADERLRALEAELEGLEDQAAARGEALHALGIERRYLEAYRGFARSACSEGTTAPSPQTAEWARTLAFLRERAQAADERTLALERERQTLQDQAGILRQRIQQVRTPEARVTRTVEMTLEADRAGNAAVTCSYQVGNATWSPVYDARLDPASRRIGFGYFGAIRQQTGEDWDQVRITLSTARPSVGAERPRLPALQLTGRKRGHEKEVRLAQGYEKRDEAPDASAPPAPASPAEAPLSVVQDRGPSVTFEIQNAATIPADGRPSRVAIASATLSPELAYETTPKLRPYVYLKATQPNSTGVPLLAGPVQVSRASGFVGTADLKFTAPGEPLSLSLGVDEAVKVHRTVLRETEEEGKGLRNRRVLTRAYDIEVANYTGAPQTVRVLDQLPVSKLEAVEVALDKSTTPPASRDAEGILTWSLALAQGEKRTIHLEFTVAMPENYRLP